jgi:hypothetical protein
MFSFKEQRKIKMMIKKLPWEKHNFYHKINARGDKQFLAKPLILLNL